MTQLNCILRHKPEQLTQLKKTQSHVLLPHMCQFSVINIPSNKSGFRGVAVSHLAEDIGTMGFLFTVQHDWLEERSTRQIFANVRGALRE